MDVKEWLEENKQLYKVSKLESLSGIPKDTLQKVVQGKQEMPDKWKDKFSNFIRNHAKGILDNIKIF